MRWLRRRREKRAFDAAAVFEALTRTDRLAREEEQEQAARKLAVLRELYEAQLGRPLIRDAHERD